MQNSLYRLFSQKLFTVTMQNSLYRLSARNYSFSQCRIHCIVCQLQINHRHNTEFIVSSVSQKLITATIRNSFYRLQGYKLSTVTILNSLYCLSATNQSPSRYGIHSVACQIDFNHCHDAEFILSSVSQKLFTVTMQNLFYRLSARN